MHPVHRVLARTVPALVLAAALALVPAAAWAVSFHSSAIDLSPNDFEGWVVNPDHGSVSCFGTQGGHANELLAEVPVGREPWCVDVHPTNGEVWVTSMRDDHVYIVDETTRAVVDSIAAGFQTFGVAFDPTGTLAAVTAAGSDEVFIIDVATRAVLHTFDVYRRPRGIAWQPDGSRVWINHLLMPEYFGRLTVIETTGWTASEVNLLQVFGTNRGGYLSTMQNMTFAPAPFDAMLWLPATAINSAKGERSGTPYTPTNMFHAVVRPIDTSTDSDMNWDTYFLSEGGTPRNGYAGGTTPVGAPIAVDFKSGRAYVANMHSNDVTVLDDDIMNPQEIMTFAVGSAPIGVVSHPAIHRVFVANWLSRDITAFNTSQMALVATFPVTTSEPLGPRLLNGKQLFFTSTGRMSFENRNSCSGCHVFGHPDGHTWDLTQFGKYVRATPDWHGSAFTGILGWTGTFDEIHDNEWSIRGMMGGAGLIDGTPNPNLGPPNRGLSQDLDDLSNFIAMQTRRKDTPFTNPDGSLTAEADSGRVLFHDPTVACASCHVPPWFTDSADPPIRHDVGTCAPDDTTCVGGFDTPSLVGVWDNAPYLQDHQAKTLEAVLTTFNPNDQHGVTSHLAPDQIGFLVAYMNSIGWPDSTGTPVAAPDVAAAAAERALDPAFPNPFRVNTALRFRVDAPSNVRVEIFDVNGRRVRTLLDRSMPRGVHIVGWDGRSDGGRAVAAGVYLAQLRVDGERVAAKKMTVLR
jgi:YVTN family beta-propeller protein